MPKRKPMSQDKAFKNTARPYREGQPRSGHPERLVKKVHEDRSVTFRDGTTIDAETGKVRKRIRY
jgi:hypothetical protein